MKFRYYITDLFDGIIKGTNDSQVAKDHSLCEDYFVVDTDTGQMLNYDEGLVDIQEIEKY